MNIAQRKLAAPLAEDFNPTSSIVPDDALCEEQVIALLDDGYPALIVINLTLHNIGRSIEYHQTKLSIAVDMTLLQMHITALDTNPTAIRQKIVVDNINFGSFASE